MITDTTKAATAKTLKNLIRILHDGHDGFRTASENVKNPPLKEIFSRFSIQRLKFAGELETELRALGEPDPQEEGNTFAGTVHRGWIDLKAAFTNGDDHAVLSEAERGEDAAKKAYRDAFEQKDIPASVRQVIASQALEIKSAHDEVKALRDAAKKR